MKKNLIQGFQALVVGLVASYIVTRSYVRITIALTMLQDPNRLEKVNAVAPDVTNLDSAIIIVVVMLVIAGIGTWLLTRRKGSNRPRFGGDKPKH